MKRYWGYISDFGNKGLLRIISDGYEMFIRKNVPNVRKCDFISFDAEVERENGFTLYLKNPVGVKVLRKPYVSVEVV